LYFSSAGQVLEEQQSGAVVNQNVWGLGYVNDLVLRDHFNSAGALDSSFGSGGKVTTTVGSSDIAYKTLVQGDGKIVVVGYNSTSGVVIRYNADGSLDSGFGSSGVKSIDFGAWDYANAVALQSDGKIVLGGATGTGPGTGTEDWAVARLTTSGALDTTFNSTGKQTLDWSADDVINGITVQDSGKIVAVGLANSASGMARFTTSGSLDTTFGSGGTGKVALSGDWDQSMNLASLSDERLLVTGVSAGEVALHRFTADGLADSTFGTGGTVATTFGATDWGYDVGVQPDGKIIIVGASYGGAGADGIAARYNVDGTLDTTFGTSGKTLIWYGSSSYSESDYFESVAIQKDGQIVVAGTAAGKFALARMNGGLTRLYAQQDANYNVTSVVDVSGNVKQRFVYTPYGVMTVVTAAWASTSDAYGWQYTFQDGRYDPAAGTVNFDVRVYNPQTGTWEQEDGGYWDGMDLYRLESGNPIAFTDPYGLAGMSDSLVQTVSHSNADGSTSSDIYTDFGHVHDTSSGQLIADPPGSAQESEANLWQFLAFLAQFNPEDGDPKLQEALVDAAGPTKDLALKFSSSLSTKMIAECAGLSNDQKQDIREAIAHLSWQAELTRKHGSSNAKVAGDIHEIHTGRPDDTARDQANNVVGREIGRQAQSWADVQARVEKAIRDGKAFKIGPDGKPVPFQPCPCGSKKKK
jgi:uncharacterized delta-60 repeat protein/RHS repeat-associated protein